MSAAVLRHWSCGEGGDQLAEWAFDPEDIDGQTRARARAALDEVVASTREEVGWGEPAAIPHTAPESVHGILEQALAPDQRNGLLFRISIDSEGVGAPLVLRVGWAPPPTGRLDDHDEIERALHEAASHVRALVASERFGRGSIDDLAAIELVEAHDIDADDAFDLRAHDTDDEDSFSNRAERALGAARGLYFRRRDYRHWSSRASELLRPILTLARDRLEDPWGCEVACDLPMILLLRAFGTSGRREVEELRPFIDRLERVYAAGGLPYGARGDQLGTAVVLACPGPGER